MREEVEEGKALGTINLPKKLQRKRAVLLEGIRNHKQRAFLAAYIETAGIQEASKLARVDWRMHYTWKREDPAYLAAYEAAQDVLADKMEAEVHRRAVDGFDHPIVYRGEVVGSYKQFSDLLLMFALKGARPHKYRDEDGGPATNITVNILNFSGVPSPTDTQSEGPDKILIP